MIKIGAVIVLYNPDINVLERAINFYKGFDAICFVDNSEYVLKSYVKNICAIHNYDYIDNEGNQGIAKALNVGCNYLSDLEVAWVVTLDQDTILPENYYLVIKSFISSVVDNSVAMIVPNVKWFRNQKRMESSCTDIVKECKTAITSGSVLDLRVFKQISGFNDDLFIDNVDNDFCYRIRLSGYKILQLQKLFIDHQLGDTFEITIFGRHLTFVTNHNYIRKYYIIRNTMYLFQKYDKNFHEEMKLLRTTTFLLIVKVVFFEKDKYRKLKSMLLGYRDFKNGQYGKLDIKRLK